jgi:hypothetical protein
MSNLEETKDYYIDSFGRLTYKAEYHLERGDCCFNYCLHCPYGSTVEKYGFKIQSISASVLEFSLKGHTCAHYDLTNKQWNIFPRFQNQNLEDDLNLSLRIFYKDKDAQ